MGFYEQPLHHSGLPVVENNARHFYLVISNLSCHMIQIAKTRAYTRGLLPNCRRSKEGRFGNSSG
ncbi:unnamed protein product [Ixodes pacificus]